MSSPRFDVSIVNYSYSQLDVVLLSSQEARIQQKEATCSARRGKTTCICANQRKGADHFCSLPRRLRTLWREICLLPTDPARRTCQHLVSLFCPISRLAEDSAILLAPDASSANAMPAKLAAATVRAALHRKCRRGGSSAQATRGRCAECPGRWWLVCLGIRSRAAKESPGRTRPTPRRPCAVGLVSGPIILSCSIIKRGHPCVTISRNAYSCLERTGMK